jgi:glutamyl-tRNA synthetase
LNPQTAIDLARPATNPTPRVYRGRLAPTPTGLLHLGHAATFCLAAQRARDARGALVMRIENLDTQRCKPQFAAAALDDLRWLGLRWDEGPDCGGAFGPYTQSQRRQHYLDLWRRLRDRSLIYPSEHSRRDVEQAATAPHDDEPLFPTAWRPAPQIYRCEIPCATPVALFGINWRFRVPDGERISFRDERLGEQTFTAGVDFGDFAIWRRDDAPAYELAVVADDHALQISEVVRGEDLLTSTARQLLLYRAAGWAPPKWFHAPLLRDADGKRLAKRDNARSIQSLREQGLAPAQVWQLTGK